MPLGPWNPLYEILPTLIFFRKYKKSAAEGKSKTPRMGSKMRDNAKFHIMGTGYESM